MKKLLWVILCSVMVLCTIIFFSGCGNNSTATIVGRWRGYECQNVYEQSSEKEFELFEDGSCDWDNSVYYEVNDNGTIVALDKYHYPNVTYNYILEEDKLWLTNEKHGEPDTSSNLYFERVN